MTTSTTTRDRSQRNEDYRDENTALFHERTALKSELETLIEEFGEQGVDAATRRKIRKLRRRLDDVTTDIVNFNMGLVRSYTRRFTSTAGAENRSDFESAGLLGLMRAVDSYDPDAGAFGQWAFKPIQREVLRAVRDRDHANMNLGDFEKRPAILRAFRELQGIDESYRPSDEEVAAASGTTVTQVRRVLSPPRVESMNRPAGDSEDTEVAELIPSDERSPEAMVVSMQTLRALEDFGLTALDARELYVVVRRFGLDGEPMDKLADIGEALALSREAVRQIEVKALAKLQHPMVMGKLQAARLSDRTAAESD